MSVVKVKFISEQGRMPTKATDGSAGFDLFAAEDAVVPAATVGTDRHVDVGSRLVPLGIAIELPLGAVGRIASRSGLSVKFNLEVGAGWIDSDYRGELMVEIKNLSSRQYEVKRGDRIAQLIILQLATIELVASENLSKSNRESGFGSTGD